MNEREYICKEVERYFLETAAHTLGHLNRVAEGAAWFVDIESGNKRDKELAYIAGLLHDFYRPPTENKLHSEKSASKAKKILEKVIGLDTDDISRILEAINDHKGSSCWKDSLHSSVYLADKILEQMGAYAVFRRCLYVGECKDFINVPFKEVILSYFKKRLSLLKIKNFPKRYFSLVDYRNSIPLNFFNELKDGKAWTWEIARYAYESGRRGTKIEECIERFKPDKKETRKLKQEALVYIRAKDFSWLVNFVKEV